ncbi:hypothetical protein BBta_p0295 (plasmid) [Bradyrhizobium sp. BTAi1]|nr:hypothetical protein BBta_p0295 [Bradyrhizobium sp. BTAi1]
MNRGLPRLRCTAAGQTRCRRFGPDLLDKPRPARGERIFEAAVLGIIIPSTPEPCKFTTLTKRLLQRGLSAAAPRSRVPPTAGPGCHPVRDRDRIGDLDSVRHLGRARPSSRELASPGSIVMAVTWPGFGQSAEAKSIAKLEMRLVRRIRTQGRGIAGVRDGAITCDIGLTRSRGESTSRRTVLIEFNKTRRPVPKASRSFG